MTDRRPLVRGAGLLVVAFVATLVILAGLFAVVSGRQPGSSGSPSAIAVAPSAAPVSPSLGVSPSRVPSATVSPQSSQVPDPVLVGAGDIADCGPSGDEETAKLLDTIEGTVFTAGDNAYPEGTAAQFKCYDETWGRFKARTRPAVGNHDYGTKGAAGYLAYFGKAAVNENGEPWYSFDLGTWHVVVLNSECSETGVGGCKTDSPQGKWLAADLAASTARCTLAIWHEPRFSSGFHGNDRAVGPFWKVLYEAGADLVVNGHDHDYERFAPQTPDGVEDRERGIREFVVGTGGTNLRKFEEIVPNSELRAAVNFGVLKLTLHPSGYDWQFIPTSGDFSDSGSAPCH